MNNYSSSEPIPENHLLCPKCKTVVPHNHHACVDIVQLEFAEANKKIQENQLNLQEKQTLFNKYLLLATTTLALIGFYPLTKNIVEDMGFPEWINLIIPTVIAGIILFLIVKLAIFTLIGKDD